MTKPQRSIREEANALICCAVRNGFIEDLHAGEWSELLQKPNLSRITDEEMKRLMIESTAKLAELLELKESNPTKYWELIEHFCNTYTKKWKKD